MSYSEMPVVELGTIQEHYADCIDLDVIGTIFWTTYFRIQREWGTRELVRVPLVRIGRPLAQWQPGSFDQRIKELCRPVINLN